MRPTPRIIATCAVLALGAASCGGSSSSARAAGLGAEEFGLDFAELAERAEQGEVLIGECMTAAGFEYVAVDFDTIREAMTSDKSAPGLSSSDFRVQFGFGISTQPDKPIVELGRGVDNVAIFDSLPEADQTAYLRTLYGDHTDATWAYGLEAEDLSRTGGCTREAAEVLFTPTELTVTYFNPADALIEDDERIQAALAEYASCMNDAGFEYTHPDQVEDDMFARLDAITGGQEIDALSDAALDDQSALQDFERSVAPISEGCEASLIEPVEDQVERELFGG